MTIYSKEIMKHFKKPRNVGKIKNADALGSAGNPLCGDIMNIYLKIRKNKKGEKIIKDIKFETFGCVVAIANTSLLTTLVKNKKIEEALKITKEDLIKKLGKPLPPIKIHCSILALDALKEAIYNYFLKNNCEISKELERDHQKIMKTQKEIEKRYARYTKLSKKVLGK